MTPARRWLHLGEGLKLPIDVVTAAGVITGQRGTGKSSTAVVEVEEADACGAPSVIIDPTGVWWGVRHGDRPLRHVLFGSFRGAEADLPLRPEDGPALARLVAEQRMSVVLGLRGWTKSAQIRFVAEFAEAFYLANHTPVLLVIDEAHRFAPARLSDSERGGYGARCQGAVVDIVTLGRVNGIGVRLITQRMARLHADARESCELVIAHRLLGKNDRRALGDWLDDLDDTGEDVAGRLLARLPKLATGEALAIAPTFGVLDDYRIRPKRTFDSSATPEVGAAVVEPQGRATVDLRHVERVLGEALEQAKAEDPKALREQLAATRARVHDLERDLDEMRVTHEHDSESLMADRNLSQSELDDLAEMLGLPKDGHHGAVRDRVRSLLERPPVDVTLLTEAYGTAEHALADLADAERRLVRDVAAIGREIARLDPATDEHDRRKIERDHPAPEPDRVVVTVPMAEPEQAASNGDRPELVAGARRMLDVLERYGPLTRAELFTLAKSHGGAARNNLSALRAHGLVVEEAGRVDATPEGIAIARSGTRAGPLGPFSPEQVAAMYEDDLVAGARRILSVLMRSPDKGFTRSELEGLAQSRGGAFRNNLSALRRKGLAEEHRRRVFPGHALYADRIRAGR